MGEGRGYAFLVRPLTTRLGHSPASPVRKGERPVPGGALMYTPDANLSLEQMNERVGCS